MMVAIVAILKSGGAYVALDPNYPEARLQYMVADSSVKHILTLSTLAAQLPEAPGVEVVLLDDVNISTGGTANLPRTASQNPVNVAYVIYTSGSTGQPKGVECYGSSVINLLQHFESLAPVSSDAAALMWTSVSFDVSVYEMMSALLYGRTLHITCDETRLDPDALFAYLQREQVNSCYLPPFMIKDFVLWLEKQAAKPPLQRLLVGVEAILLADLQAIRALIPGIEIINGYGPSEATVCSSLYRIDDRPQPQLTFAPIGRPVNNCQLLVLDDNLALVPLGSCGELYIGGAGLAQGYLNQPQLTAERFIQNPFSDDAEARLYKTGDVVRYLPGVDGEPENLLFVGRMDEQVKINGLRIELGEIESQINDGEAVQSAHVLLREDQPGHKRLVAYVMPATGQGVGANSPDEIQVEYCRQLKEALRGQLPEHMMPSGFALVDEWPLTVNGKLDKKAMLALELVSAAHVAPGNETEAALVALIAEQVGIDEQQLGVTTSFFELGLSSLKLFAVINQVNRQFSLTLAPAEIYHKSTIQLLAAHISASSLIGQLSSNDEEQYFEEDGEI